MKTHLSNAAYGMADYLAYPLGMLAVAPVALWALGIERYGIWTMATATLTTGAIVASGFGDANIRSVAIQLALGDRKALLSAVRTTLAIHMVLGCLMASLGWLVTPWVAARVTMSHAELYEDCLWSLRIASLLMLARAIETVCVSTQRAYGRYGAAVGVSVLARLLTLAGVCLLPFVWRTVTCLLIAAALISAVATWIQMEQLKRLIGVSRLLPMFDRDRARSILGFGAFTWLQSVGGLLFGQADRLIIGASFGAAALSTYGICAQLSQPIYGLAAAGLHFLFPYLTSREALHQSASLRRGLLVALAANLLFVLCALSGLLLFGKVLLGFLGGAAVARAGSLLLPVIASSAALSALSITGSYSMLALGRAGAVTILSLCGGLAMLAAAPWLMARFGLEGMGYARLLYGPFALLVYVPLSASLGRTALDMRPNEGSACEEA
jgi:O-antigen/teichoic acid export membrane protein